MKAFSPDHCMPSGGLTAREWLHLALAVNTTQSLTAVFDNSLFSQRITVYSIELSTKYSGSEIKDRPLVRDYQIVPRTSKYYNSVVRWTTEFIRNFSGTTWCYKS